MEIKCSDYVKNLLNNGCVGQVIVERDGKTYVATYNGLAPWCIIEDLEGKETDKFWVDPEFDEEEGWYNVQMSESFIQEYGYSIIKRR